MYHRWPPHNTLMISIVPSPDRPIAPTPPLLQRQMRTPMRSQFSWLDSPWLLAPLSRIPMLAFLTERQTFSAPHTPPEQALSRNMRVKEHRRSLRAHPLGKLEYAGTDPRASSAAPQRETPPPPTKAARESSPHAALSAPPALPAQPTAQYHSLSQSHTPWTSPPLDTPPQTPPQHPPANPETPSPRHKPSDPPQNMSYFSPPSLIIPPGSSY
mmetsp:Transcript_17190/g.35720  ORF Transcript_17190/g.35720 Transcript_17190/m.35720 type:complete len:213 (-) Transcript_17190:52-690(-)